MDAFWQAAFLIFLAEMGDKSQLVSLAFATRYSWKIALAGVTVATLVVHLFSVLLGEVLGQTIPPSGFSWRPAWPSSASPSGPSAATPTTSPRATSAPASAPS